MHDSGRGKETMARFRTSYTTLLLMLVCGSALLSLALWYVFYPNYPSGDEPHYLIISQTLLKYHSLAVMQDYTHGDYHVFYPLPITPHAIPGAHGQVLSIHGIGGPILWLLPFALLGWLGVVLFMTAVTLLIIWNMYLFLLTLDIEKRYALPVCVGYAVASPLTLYAHLTFIEPIAALLCLYVSRKIVQQEGTWRDSVLCSMISHMVSGFALGLLPWIHIRFALPEIILFCIYLYRLYTYYGWPCRKHLTPYLAFLLPVVLLFIGFEGYTLYFWGTLNPTTNQASIGNTLFTHSFLIGLLGMLFDQEYGVLLNFPIFFFLFVGIILSCKKKFVVLNVLVLLLSGVYLYETATFKDWTGGWCPPARFILVLLPLYSFYVAYALQQLRTFLVEGLFWLCIAYGAFYNVLAIQHSFNRKSGQNLTLVNVQLFHHSITDYLPSFFLPHQENLLFLWIGIYGGVSLLLLGVVHFKHGNRFVPSRF